MPKQWIARAALATLLFVVATSSTRIALAEDVLVAEFSGSGIQSTRPFTVKGPWEVQWSSEGSFLAIMLKKPDEPDGFPKIIANQQGSGPGSSYQPQGGTYYFETNAIGGWHIKVVEIR